MTTPVHVLRPGRPGDRGYIVDTWLKSYQSSPFAKRLPPDVYWSRFGHVGLVEDLIARCFFTVACLPDDEDYLYAWYCFDELPTLHYMFVRHDYRRLGFARVLLARFADQYTVEGTPLKITHVTPDFSRYVARGWPVEFVNPYRSKAA